MALEISNLTKVFGEQTAVDSININVPDGSMYGFLGGNGAGKTTTFRMILKLLTPTEGSILYNGETIGYHMTDSIGYLPEERGLHPKLTVSEQIIYLAELKGMSKKDANSALDYWLDRFKVTENKFKKIEKLAKGNQQQI